MTGIQKIMRGRMRSLGLLLIGIIPLFAYGCVSIPTPRISIVAYQSDNPPRSITYRDPDINLSQLRKYAFDYTNQENPLLEKELFKILAELLSQKGYLRDESNPDMLITMNFYVGRKESYVPPKTITTTRIENVWSVGMFGMTLTGQAIPVPITESQTTQGYTEVSFYKNIRVNFLDYAKLKRGEKSTTPPLLWIGEVESTGKDPDIRNDAASMLGTLIFGPYSRIKCGSVEIEGYLRGKLLVVQSVKKTSQTPGPGVDIKEREIVRTIHGVAPADYIYGNRDTLPASVTGPSGVRSSGTITWYYGIEGNAVEIEVENPATKAVRKVLVQ